MRENKADGVNITLCLNRVFPHKMQMFTNATGSWKDSFHECRWALRRYLHAAR